MFSILFLISLLTTSSTASDSTYGTMPKSCVISMIEKGPILKSDVVVDMGSGIGNVCYYFSPFVSKCIGYEIDEIRYNISKKIYSEKEKASPLYSFYFRDTEKESIEAPIPDNVEFYLKNFLTLDNLDADVMIAHSTTWSDETLKSLYSLASKSERVRLLITHKRIKGNTNYNNIPCEYNWDVKGLHNIPMKAYDIKHTDKEGYLHTEI